MQQPSNFLTGEYYDPRKLRLAKIKINEIFTSKIFHNMKKLYKILFLVGGGGEAILQGAIFLGAILRGATFLGGLFPEGIFPWGIFPEGIFPSTLGDTYQIATKTNIFPIEYVSPC